jgi:group I intron endonuclease
MKKGFIYIIKNTINSKVYIGQTTQTVETRFKQHLKCLKSNSVQLISKAIKKYGKSNFYVEILEECFIEELNKKEEHYIKLYNSFSNGYNLCRGGNQSRKPKLQFDTSKIIELYNNGNSTRKIAKKFNTCHRVILNLLKENNVEIRLKTINLPDKTKISELLLKDLLQKDLSIREIARQLDVQHSSVRNAIKRFNL